MLDKLPDAIPDDRCWTLGQFLDYLLGKTAEELAEKLRPVSHNNCSVKRAEKILNLVKSDGETRWEHQESRDAITRSLDRDLEHYRVQLEEVNEVIENLLLGFNCTMATVPGIDVITAANMLSEIGGITRFSSADKLAKFSGIAQSIYHRQGKGRQELTAGIDQCIQTTGEYLNQYRHNFK